MNQQKKERPHITGRSFLDPTTDNDSAIIGTPMGSYTDFEDHISNPFDSCQQVFTFFGFPQALKKSE